MTEPKEEDGRRSPISKLLSSLGLTRDDLFRRSEQMRQFLRTDDPDSDFAAPLPPPLSKPSAATRRHSLSNASSHSSVPKHAPPPPLLHVHSPATTPGPAAPITPIKPEPVDTDAPHAPPSAHTRPRSLSMMDQVMERKSARARQERKERKAEREKRAAREVDDAVSSPADGARVDALGVFARTRRQAPDYVQSTPVPARPAPDVVLFPTPPPPGTSPTAHRHHRPSSPSATRKRARHADLPPSSPPAPSPVSSPVKPTSILPAPSSSPAPIRRGCEGLPYVLPPGPYFSNKPELSYAALIGQAILSAPDHRLTLQEIYDWITTVYPFYTRDEPTWMNSVRHVLSTTKVFRKVPRAPKMGRMLWAIWDADLPCFEGGGFRRQLCSDMASEKPKMKPGPKKRSAGEMTMVMESSPLKGPKRARIAAPPGQATMQMDLQYPLTLQHQPYHSDVLFLPPSSDPAPPPDASSSSASASASASYRSSNTPYRLVRLGTQIQPYYQPYLSYPPPPPHLAAPTSTSATASTSRSATNPTHTTAFPRGAAHYRVITTGSSNTGRSSPVSFSSSDALSSAARVPSSSASTSSFSLSSSSVPALTPNCSSSSPPTLGEDEYDDDDEEEEQDADVNDDGDERTLVPTKVVSTASPILGRPLQPVYDADETYCGLAKGDDGGYGAAFGREKGKARANTHARSRSPRMLDASPTLVDRHHHRRRSRPLSTSLSPPPHDRHPAYPVPGSRLTITSTNPPPTFAPSTPPRNRHASGSAFATPSSSSRISPKRTPISHRGLHMSPADSGSLLHYKRNLNPPTPSVAAQQMFEYVDLDLGVAVGVDVDVEEGLEGEEGQGARREEGEEEQLRLRPLVDLDEDLCEDALISLKEFAAAASASASALAQPRTPSPRARSPKASDAALVTPKRHLLSGYTSLAGFAGTPGAHPLTSSIFARSPFRTPARATTTATTSTTSDGGAHLLPFPAPPASDSPFRLRPLAAYANPYDTSAMLDDEFRRLRRRRRGRGGADGDGDGDGDGGGEEGESPGVGLFERGELLYCSPGVPPGPRYAPRDVDLDLDLDLGMGMGMGESPSRGAWRRW